MATGSESTSKDPSSSSSDRKANMEAEESHRLLSRDDKKANEFDRLLVGQTSPRMVLSDAAIVDLSNLDTIPDPSIIESQSQHVMHDPAPLSQIAGMGRERCLEHLSSLHDDVEKMFTTSPRTPSFDLAGLSSMTTPVVDTAKAFDDADYKPMLMVTWKQCTEDLYSNHRRDSLHMHHPLKSMPNHRMARLSPRDTPHSAHKKKRKKHKEKKRKRSFPSKIATLSPTIPEGDEEVVDGGDEESETSDDDYEDEFADDGMDEEEELSSDASAPVITMPTFTIPPPSSAVITIPDINVGFYIGDDSRQPSTSSGFPGGIDPRRPSTDSVAVLSATPSVEAIQFKRQVTAEPMPSPMFSDISNEPQISEQASGQSCSKTGSFKKLSTPEHAIAEFPEGEKEEATVTFMLGAPTEIDLNITAQPSEEKKEEKKERVYPAKSSTDGQRTHHVHANHHSPNRHHHNHHHREHFNFEDLMLRRQLGSNLGLDQTLRRVPTEIDEATMLQKADLDDMASHRWEDVRGIRRHKIAKHNALASVVHIGKRGKVKKPFLKAKKKFDHNPHEVFVELEELHAKSTFEYEWREKARWIKFEEDVEEGAERWGKPHVASLSFHSLLELRKGLETGSVLLDMEATDLVTIVSNVVEDLIKTDQIHEEDRANVLRTLLLKHKHVSERKDIIRRNLTYLNLWGLDHLEHYRKDSVMRNASVTSQPGSPNKDKDRVKGSPIPTPTHDYIKLELLKGDPESFHDLHVGFTPMKEPSSSSVRSKDASDSEARHKQVQEIMKRIPLGSEATTVLVGSVDFLDSPAVAFVRLAEGQFLGNLTEVPLPVRFIFILLGPASTSMDYHEVGRSISTLMSNQHFHDVAYRADSRTELLGAINEFLDESIVLPPGDWDQKTLLPIMDMARKRAGIRRRKRKKTEEKDALLDGVDGVKKPPTDPLQRTKRPFGGLINDVKRRYPHYVSDFRDGIDPQCLAAFVFIFFACLSPCIAFGGLLSEKTDGWMGVTETIIATSIAGIVFGLFAGQPILIVGYTGPVLVFEQTFYQFCQQNEIEFLPMRCWVGFWIFLLATTVVALEGSFIVRYVTRFTEEIFTALVALIFIYEVIKKLTDVYMKHPLLADYCFTENGVLIDGIDDNSTLLFNATANNESSYQASVIVGYSVGQASTSAGLFNDSGSNDLVKKQYTAVLNKPNTALLSTILTIGTFLIAYFLRIFRNSTFLGRTARRTLGDFGVLIAIVVMVVIDYLIHDTYTQKLAIPDGVTPTAADRRGWFINPMGMKQQIQVWMMFAAIIPALLVFILLFMETQIAQVIINKKERNLKKGSGYHLDMFLIGILAGVTSLFGMPWLCVATVRSVTHVSALTVFSQTHAPGEKQKLIGVKEQRLTNILVNICVGLSLAIGPLLREIPMAVLFGVFLYMGVSSMTGVQLFERLKLLLMPVKHHPQINYVRRVKTMKMHLYTIIQLLSLAILWAVKSTAAALAFPFVLMTLVPLRLKVMRYIFNDSELNELDKDTQDSEDEEEDDDPDFYKIAHMPM